MGVDIKDLFEKLKKNLEVEIKSDSEMFNDLVKNLTNLIAENALLKAADLTARSVMLTTILDNGGSLTIKKLIDYHTSGYEISLDKTDSDYIVLKAVKKDVTVN
jgi:hypothetical protein